MRGMRYVIIGNSTAAVGCVEGIRKVDREGEIVLIASEPHHTYARPLISYLLLGRTDEEHMKYRPDSFYEENGVQAHLGTTLERVDAETKTVYTDKGDAIAYDKLLLATGSRPFVPPMEGLDTVEKKFSFMTLDDAHALNETLTPESRVLIVGAGLIGLKCAEGILHRVGHIQVIDLAPRILPSILDEAGSALVQANLEKQGIEMKLATTVKSFSGSHAVLMDGSECDFDVLVLAVGVRANTDLATGIGAKTGRGIVVDEEGKTTVPDVFAAGDCTETRDITSDTVHVMAILPNAYLQGEAAGFAMAGSHRPFTNAIPMNAIGFFHQHMITAGSYEGEALVWQEGENYKKLVIRDGKLVGFILIGDVARAGIYTSLIRNQTPLSEVDFEKLKDHPQLLAFSGEVRGQKLGGVPR